MSFLKIITVVSLFLLSGMAASAQQSGKPPADSSALNEALLVKDEQQKKIDSLVKQQLEQELLKVTGNAKRTNELEAQLRSIAKADSLRGINQMKKLNALKKTTKGYPVKLNLDTLFFIYTRTGSFNPEERADAVSAKIEKLYTAAIFKPDSLVVVENEGNYDITYNNDDIVISIGNLDGLWLGKPNAELAKEYLRTIKQNVIRERDEHSLTNLIKRLGLVALIVCFLLVIVVVINRIFRRISDYISAHKEHYLTLFKLKQVKVITAEHLESGLLKFIGVLKLLVVILIIYLSLPLLFSLFPETEGWTWTLLGWILGPLRSAGKAVVDYLPDFFKVVIIVLLFRFLLKGIRYLFYEVKRGNMQFRGFHADWAIPTFNILRFILYAFMLVLIFPFLPGSSSPAFQGVSVFLGILISLGSSSAITNIVAGLVITYMRPFRIGDRVKIGEVVGDVMEKSMLVTRIKTIKNEDITVPNSLVLSSSTINYSSHTKNERQGLIIHYTVTVGYDVAWQQVYQLLIDAALKTNHIQSEPTPFVLQTSLDDFYISYQINAYTKEANKQATIYSNLLENIQDVFREAGIEIMSPSYHVVRDGGKESADKGNE